MRTAIYVHEPSTIAIRATDPGDARIEICRYHEASAEPAVGTRTYQPGIYLIVSRAPVEVAGRHLTVETMGNDKDNWPDPKPNVIALEPGATAASLQAFFAVAKDLSLDG